MHYLSLIILLFLFSGCNEGSTNTRPYVTGSNAKQSTMPTNVQYGLHGTDRTDAARIKAESEKEIAQINMEKEILIQELKGATEVEKAVIGKEISLKQVEADKHKAIIKKDIVLTQDQTQLQIALNKLEIDKWIVLIVGLLILALIIFLFYNSHRNRKERLKIHEDKLKQELLIQEQQMRVQIAERLIDAMSSGNLSSEQENKLLGAYSTTPENNQLPYHTDDEEEITEEIIVIDDMTKDETLTPLSK